MNEAAEKLNEIPGRQLRAEPEPMVEIRSAVHSNYAGMVAMLDADNRVYLGKEECYHFAGDQPAYYDNSGGSLCFVTDRADMYYCWGTALRRISMQSLPGCSTASSGSLRYRGSLGLQDSPSRPRRITCGMRSFRRKDRQAIII